MKNRYIFVIFVGLLLTGCDFLKEDPKSAMPENKVLTSDTDVRQQAVLYLYNFIGSDTQGEGLQGTYRGVYDLQTFASDEAMIPIRGGDWLDGGVWQELYAHTWTADNEVCANAWIYLYRLVGLSNRSLVLLDEYRYLLTDEQYNKYNAEVRSVRALAYMYLLDLFARVPIVTSNEVNVQDIVQSERSQVFHFVWDELQAARPYLSEERSNLRGEYYGRITRPVLDFMLMKLALNAEVWTDDNWLDSSRPDGNEIMLLCDGETKNAWEAVVYYGEEFKKSTKHYELDESTTMCFAAYNENSRENIFIIPVNPSVYRNRFKNIYRSLHYQHAAALAYGGENGTCATLRTLDVFGYGTTHKDCRFEMFFFADTIEVKHKKLILSDGSVLVYQPREVKPDLTGSPYVATAGARMSKYEIDPAAIFDGQLQDNDIVLFRMADVFLMMAEAKVRMGQSGQEEFDLVRNREAGYVNTIIIQRDATLENIYYERWMELMWEGWHRQDMIRFDCYTSPIDCDDDVIMASPELADRYKQVFPIPQIALQTNTGLIPNPGY